MVNEGSWQKILPSQNDHECFWIYKEGKVERIRLSPSLESKCLFVRIFIDDQPMLRLMKDIWRQNRNGIEFMWDFDDKKFYPSLGDLWLSSRVKKLIKSMEELYGDILNLAATSYPELAELLKGMLQYSKNAFQK